MRLSRRRPLRTAMACVVSAFLVVASVAPVSAATPSPVTSGPFKLIGNFAIGPQGAYLCSTFAVEAVYIAGGGHVDDARWTLSGPGFLEDPQPSWFEHFVDQAAGTFVITATSGAYRASATIVVHLRPDPLPGPKPVCVAPTPTPAGCDLKGVVVDGAATDDHQNPLVGILVQLLQNGSPVGQPMVTASDGSYCLPSGVVTPGDYQLRASLIDAEHDPPVFETRHAGVSDAVAVLQDVAARDFGRQDLDLTFSATADRPWLADVANIHWQSGRFVTWLLNVLVLDPTELGHLVIETGAPEGTRYDVPTKTVIIQASDTPFAKRSDGTTECPENCEWHEITHGVEEVIGVAPEAAAACEGSAAHAGWTNDSTCDSLAEGFASFLPTLASLEIDAGRGPNYADPRYSFFGSLEDNGFRPWSYHAEDFAVAQLLWDLADDTPTETTTLAFKEAGATAVATTVVAHDRVGIGGAQLVALLAQAKPATVADIYDALVASPAVPAALKTLDLDLNADGTADLSPLAELFIAHGFHPSTVVGSDTYVLGDPIGLTQPGANNLSVRPHIEAIPGSAIRLQNASGAPVTFSIDITYPSTTSHIEVVVAANTERVVHLELPPYWAGGLTAGSALPACGNPDWWPVTLTISAAGSPSRTVSSCEYLQAVAATTTDSALTYAVAGSAPTTTPAGASGGTPAIGLLVAVAVALTVALGIGFVILRRRRTTPS